MALGYCTYCDTLRNIRPGAQKWGSRECAWYPTAHWINTHEPCGNIVFLTEAATCVKCGLVPVDEVISSRCPGEKKSL
jgi:hypothetical protein